MTLRNDPLRGTLIVSCQASRGGPLDRPSIIAALAAAAVAGGAGGIRVASLAHIRAVRRTVDVPIIGLIKRRSSRSDVYITPSIRDAEMIIDAGADLVAIDSTRRPRQDGTAAVARVAELVALGIEVVADVDTLDAAHAAAAAGAAYIATTLAGYTGARMTSGPDIELVAAISRTVEVPVIAEGRYRSAANIRAAFDAGAHAVVVGEAITNPTAITQHLVSATPRFRWRFGEVGRR